MGNWYEKNIQRKIHGNQKCELKNKLFSATKLAKFLNDNTIMPVKSWGNRLLPVLLERIWIQYFWKTDVQYLSKTLKMFISFKSWLFLGNYAKILIRNLKKKSSGKIFNTIYL